MHESWEPKHTGLGRRRSVSFCGYALVTVLVSGCASPTFISNFIPKLVLDDFWTLQFKVPLRKVSAG